MIGEEIFIGSEEASLLHLSRAKRTKQNNEEIDIRNSWFISMSKDLSLSPSWAASWASTLARIPTGQKRVGKVRGKGPDQVSVEARMILRR